MTLEERLAQATANRQTAEEQVRNWTMNLARAEGAIETLTELLAEQTESTKPEDTP